MNLPAVMEPASNEEDQGQVLLREENLHLKTELKVKEQQLVDQEVQLNSVAQLTSQLEDQKNLLAQKLQVIKSQEEQIDNYQSKMSDLSDLVEKLQSENQNELIVKQKVIEDLKKQIEDADYKQLETEKELQSQNNASETVYVTKIQELEGQLADIQEQSSAAIKVKEDLILQLRSQIAEKQQEIEALGSRASQEKE